MNLKKVPFRYFLIVLIGVFSILVGYNIYHIKDTKDLVEFITALVGLVVSFAAFIKFNDARATYLLKLVYPEYPEDDWEDIINEAIIARNRITILIRDIHKNKEDTYLHDVFTFEKLLAGIVNINIMIVENKDITDTLKRIKYTAPNFKGIHEDVLLTESDHTNNLRLQSLRNELAEYITTRSKNK